MDVDIRLLTDLIKKESSFVDNLLAETGKVIVGQKEMVERVIIALLCQGHILIEGVPGLAKTLIVKTIASAINAKFQRIQFTPDLLPADIIGTVIYNQQTGAFKAKRGPVFANIILADEINRAPAKVQSALLEAMQEHQVTIGDETHKLDEPFLVLATQNPIEQEGTYPLPEAQVDRFLLMIRVTYPTKTEEQDIMERNTAGMPQAINPVIQPAELLRARETISQIYMDEKIKRYIIEVVNATRNPQDYKLKELKSLISYGASPRASIYLNLCARAHAFLRHRGYVIPEDIKAIGMDVLRHRVILSYEAEAEELKPEDIIKRIFDAVEVP
ncbi:MAG: MoxR family ATPase [Deltaproteobacteria bacterium]|nr:MoxR family ATPase [Deltaproteobacteria bacterium]